jgi:hypothetical protein
MTEQTPPPYPVPAPFYAIRVHAEMTWQDVMALIFGMFTPLSIVGLLFGMHSGDAAKKLGLKQHPVGMIGLIFSALGCVLWTLFWIFSGIGAATAHADVPVSSSVVMAGPSFTDGIYEVGNGPGQFPAGRYRTDASGGLGGNGCAWSRLKHNDGASGDIIAISIHNGPQFLTVKPTDGYVSLSWGCTWTKG